MGHGYGHVGIGNGFGSLTGYIDLGIILTERINESSFKAFRWLVAVFSIFSADFIPKRISKVFSSNETRAEALVFPKGHVVTFGFCEIRKTLPSGFFQKCCHRVRWVQAGVSDVTLD